MIKDIVKSVAGAWLSASFPWMAPLQEILKGGATLSETILFEKLYFVLQEQDSDFDEWLKLSEKFNENSESYNKMIHQLIYYVNAINECELLQAYSNLLRAYKCGLICKNDFFRLSFCLTKLLAEDARYLAKNINREQIEENIYCFSLSSNNLMYNKSRGFSVDEDDMMKEWYAFTPMGKMLDKYALSYGNEEKYHYNTEDKSLAEQKLEYNSILTVTATNDEVEEYLGLYGEE